MKQTRRKSNIAGAKKMKKTKAPKQNIANVERIGEIDKLVHLLQVNQIELEHQNLELRSAEQELELSRTKYLNLFDFAPIPYFIMDMNGVIREVNLSAATIMGAVRSKLIGTRLHTSISSKDKGRFHAFIKTIFDSPVKQSCMLDVIAKNKRTIHVQLVGIKLYNVPELNHQCHIALIDLTDCDVRGDSAG